MIAFVSFTDEFNKRFSIPVSNIKEIRDAATGSGSELILTDGTSRVIAVNVDTATDAAHDAQYQ
jgi:hypothetical protein